MVTFFPATSLGKAIAGLTAISGILVLAFPLSISGASYSKQSDMERGRVAIERVHEAFKKRSAGGGEWWDEAEYHRKGAELTAAYVKRVEIVHEKGVRLANKVDRLINFFDGYLVPFFEEAHSQYPDDVIDIFMLIKGFFSGSAPTSRKLLKEEPKTGSMSGSSATVS